MISIYRSLDEKGKKRYTEKHRSVGLSLKDDSHFPEDEAKFAGDMITSAKEGTGLSMCTSVRR